jgi:Rha family phage regulatory protein
MPAQITVLPPNAVSLKDGRAITTSLDVAEVFDRRHRDVTRAIRGLDCSDEFRVRNFAHSSYLNEQGKSHPMFEMTKDGFIFLVMGFTGAEAARHKEAYIAAFNKLAQVLLNQTLMPQPAPTIEIDAAEYYKLRAELAELKLESAVNTKRRRRNFTDAEKATMRALKAQGLQPKAIGERIGRSPDSVGNFFYRENKR